jgi:hypothetical protein
MHALISFLDLFLIRAWGVTATEVLTRNEAFPTMKGTDVAFQVGYEGLLPTAPDICPDSFKPTLRKCWSPNPEDRPTAAKIATILELLLIM